MRIVLLKEDQVDKNIFRPLVLGCGKYMIQVLVEGPR